LLGIRRESPAAKSEAKVTYVLEIMANAATVITSIVAFGYGAYRARDRIRLAFCTIGIWSLTAFIRYVDFVAYYLLDPLTRMWEFLVAIASSFFDRG
jgi:hypothetical protein